MLVWSQPNETQLERLEVLIEDIDSSSSSRKKNALKEAYSILENNTLDLNRDMHEYEIPLLIKACIWHSTDMVKLLLNKGAGVNKPYNPFNCYGQDEPSDYCKDELVNSMDILLADQTEYSKMLNDPDYQNEIKILIQEVLTEIENCIKIIANFGGTTRLSYIKNL